MNMKLAAVAALLAFSGPGIANAFSITTIDDTVAAHLAADELNATTLSPGWVFNPSVTTIEAPAASIPLQTRSPWELDSGTISTALAVESPGFFTIGKDGVNTTKTTVLDLVIDRTEFSLLWGSPDTFNKLELLLDNVVVFTVIPGTTLDGPAAPQLGAAFVTITAGIGEFFDAVRFSSNQNAFEWASISATPIPLPAPVMLLLASLAGLGFLSRKRKMAAA